MSQTKREIPLWKVLFSSFVLAAVAYVVVGVVLVAYPEVSYVSLCYIAAAAVMLIGLVDVIRYILRGISEGKLNNYLSRGLVLVMVSVFMFVREDYVIIVLPVLLGLSIVVDGIIKLQRSIDLLRLHFDGWIFVLILAAMSLAIGAVLVFRPLDSAKTLTMVMGIALIYCGVTSVVVSIFVNLKLRNYKETAVPVAPMSTASTAASAAVAPAPVWTPEPAAPALNAAAEQEDKPVIIPVPVMPAPVDNTPAPAPAAEETRWVSAEADPMPAAEETRWVSAEPDPAEASPLVSENGEIPFESINLDTKEE